MMNLRVFSLLALVALGARAQDLSDASTSSPSDCYAAYSLSILDAPDPCNAIESFAVCLANATPGDPKASSVAAALDAAQQANQACDLRVTPSITVVDRKLRVVTQEDVQFTRFRRDQVGIFELKEMIETNAASVAVLEAGAQHLADTLGARVDEAVLAQTNFQEEIDDDVKVSLKATAAEVTSMNVTIEIMKGTDTILEAKIDAVKAEVIAASNAAFWLHTSPPVEATNVLASTIMLAGVGLEQYFNPLFTTMFTCTFKPTSGNSVETSGKVTKIDGEYFAIACPGPSMVKKTTSFTVSVAWNDKNGKTTIPFTGIDGANVVKFTALYTKLTQTTDTKQLIVDVKGLDVNAKYQCEFADTNSETTKTIPASFVRDTFGSKLSCGNSPNGFTIVGVYSSVTFSLLNLDTKEYVLNGGSDSNILNLNICANGIQDGTESDVDCGGKCVPLYTCGASKKCQVANDCAGGLPCTNNKCGLDGKSVKTAGKTCKAIKIQFPKSTNGIYYVKGPNNEYQSAPKRVWCWQSDRDGGGWMLGVKIYYPNQGGLPRSGQGGTGSVDNNAIQHRGPFYKLDDKEIRTFLGQPKPNNDNFDDGTSMFSWMMDQSSFNDYYSSNNREYLIGKKYTARWRMVHWTPMHESTTAHELSSYAMPRSFNGKDSVGEGKLNWRGNPKCGRVAGGFGIVCIGTRSGSPSQSPQGGRGCSENLSRNRWAGQLDIRMSNTNWDTYTNMCNGHQHSSSHRFANRQWFRTSDENKEW